jgi:hypothetical protein
MNLSPSGFQRGFVVEAGGAVNSIIPIAEMVSTVGRDPSADVYLPYDGVSRRHLQVDATGPVVFVTDAQSTNGTWVNDQREVRRTPLRDGDRVKLGTVQLRYFDVASAAQLGLPPTDVHHTTQPQPSAAGGGDPVGIKIGNNKVSGKQTIIDGGQTNIGRDQRNESRDQHNVAYGSQYNAGGDQTWKQKVKVSADYDPWDELFRGEGPGRVIAILGAIVAVGGFAWFGAHVFGFINSVSSIGAGGAAPAGFPPTIGYAFATFVLGGLLLTIGTGMSKARRKRNGR